MYEDNTKTKDTEAPTGSDELLDYNTAFDNLARFQSAYESGHSEYLDRSNTAERYFQGDQWDQGTLQILAEEGRPAITVNLIQSYIQTICGEQLKAKADVAFRPVSVGDSATASALSKIYTQITNSQDYDSIEQQLFADGVIRGRGYIDVSISKEKNASGSVSLQLLNPDYVIIDPHANSYDPDDWNELFKIHWLTLLDIEQSYGKKAADSVAKKGYSSDSAMGEIIRDPRGDFSQNQYEKNSFYRDTCQYKVIERQYIVYKDDHPILTYPDDTVIPIPPTWNKVNIDRAKAFGARTGRGRVRRIRWVVSCGEVLLYNKVSPYSHYTVVPFFPIFRRGRSMGVVESLIGPQNTYNKTISQTLHVVNTTANSGWIVKQGALRNMRVEDLETDGAKTGLVLELDDINDIEKITPNQVPTGLDIFSKDMKGIVSMLSGVSESMRGFDRADVSGRAIHRKQLAGSTNLITYFYNLAYTRKVLARNVLSLIQSFYTKERVFRITKGIINVTEEQVVINTEMDDGKILDVTSGIYDIVVAAAPTHYSEMSEQFSNLIELRKSGVEVPDEAFILASDLPNKMDMVEQMAESAKTTNMVRELEIQKLQLELQKLQADIQRTYQESGLAKSRADRTAAGVEVDLKRVEKELAELDNKIRKEQDTKRLNTAVADVKAKLDRDRLVLEQRKQDLEAQKQQLSSEGTKYGG